MSMFRAAIIGFLSFALLAFFSTDWLPITGLKGEAAQAGQNKVEIRKIWLARDDGQGKDGEVVNGFKTTDNPLHCVVRLNRADKVTQVKFVWIAVEAAGVKNHVIDSAEFTTSPPQNIVRSDLSLPRNFPAGKYKVEVTVEGKTRTVEFNIE